MIRLIDILEAQGIPLGHYKLHLATTGKSSPLHAYWQGRFKEWQEDQNGRNFQCESVLALIHRANDRWLFGGDGSASVAAAGGDVMVNGERLRIAAGPQTAAGGDFDTLKVDKRTREPRERQAPP